MSNAIKHCKDCNTTVMCHLERRCMRKAHGLSTSVGYESMTKEERQKRLDEHGITEQDLYESRQAEREAMLTAIHS